MRDGHLHVKYTNVGETLPTDHCQILRENLWKIPEGHMFLESELCISNAVEGQEHG